MGGFFTILDWTIIAAIVVLIIMNSGHVGTIIDSFGKFWLGETKVLTGSNYNK